MIARSLAFSLLTALASLALPSCDGTPTIPASSDPTGKDLVEGAVVAMVSDADGTPGYRIYKVLHVDDYPQPVGTNLHLEVFDPKMPGYPELARARKRGQLSVLLPHFEIRLVDFIGRDHRVLDVEPLTKAETAAYEKGRDRRR